MGVFNNNAPTTSNGAPQSSTTIIAEGCRLKAEVSELQGNLHVDGLFEGAINSKFDISIGPAGKIIGTLTAKNIEVSGALEGTVVCDHMHIVAKGSVNGEVSSKQLSIKDGGFFEGKSTRRNDAEKNVSKIDSAAKKK